MLESDTTTPEAQTPALKPPTLNPPNAARRVALNAAGPFVAQLFTKVLMMGYGVAQYRLVDSSRLNGYLLAGIVLLLTGTVAEWGLNTLVSREVAKGRGAEDELAQAATLFSDALVLRLVISLALFVPVGIFIAAYTAFFGLDVDGAWAVAILALSLLPGAFSGSVTALLYAYERMSLPAGIGVVTSALNVGLGVLALLLGWGVPGLAGAALVTTLATAFVFWRILRSSFPGIYLRFSRSAMRFNRGAALGLLSLGWPLMINALLVNLFFRADQFVIQPVAGAEAVTHYGAAYSFLGFVGLITPAVTLALFPRMARHAAQDRPRLFAEYTFALKLLLIISVPIVALTVWLAPLLITILTAGKPDFLPDSAVALQILIFFLPFSFINGLTQYVLIALDKQRLFVKVFALTAAFNLAANLALVPLMGINGAALATIMSEWVLLGPFLVWTGREIGSVPLGRLALKPLLGGVAVGALAWLLWPLERSWNKDWGTFSLYLAAALALVALYGAVLPALKPFNTEELKALRAALKR